MNNIITVQIDPSTSQEEITAGVMYEHNASSLKFVIDEQYMDSDYKFYLDFALPTGTLRTQYLTPDSENTILFSLPASITSQMCVLCCFNVVKVSSENYATEQLIKAKRIKLSFSSVVPTDENLCREHDFSVNTLLEAIKNGTFTGEKGEKGDKGDKGDTGEKTRIIFSAQVGETDSGDEFVITRDTENMPFRLKNVKVFLIGKSDNTANPTFTVKIRTDGGQRYLAHLFRINNPGEICVFCNANVEQGMFTHTLVSYGQGGQGTQFCETGSTISTALQTYITNLHVGFFQNNGATHIPFAEGTKLVVVGEDAQ